MAQRSRFFDSVAGDRTYTSDAWAQVITGLIGDGVVSGGNELAVSENSPQGMSVLVATGKAFIQGYFFEVYSAAEAVTIAAANATNPRIDRIVVRRDLTNRQAVLAVLTGTPAASPTAPALTQNAAGTWEISLAQVYVGAAVVVIANANITDERGSRAQGTDIAAILKAASGHAHTGVDGQGPTIAWSNVNSKPTTFTPADHTHVGAGTGGVISWANIGSKPTQFAPTDHAHNVTGAGGTISHDVLTGVSSDDHHAKLHAHDGADGSGTVAWGSITGKPSTFAPSAHASSHASGGTDPVTPGAIGALVAGSAGGGAAGVKVWVGTTSPSTGVTEGDIWVDA